MDTDDTPAVLEEQPAPEYGLTVLDAPTEEELAELERREHEDAGEGILNRDAAAAEATRRSDESLKESVNPEWVERERQAVEQNLRITAIGAASNIAAKNGNVASLLKNAQSIVDWLRDGTQPDD